MDRVPELLERYRSRELVRPFDRTAGDEVQAVTDDPAAVVDIALALVATPHWSVGIGIGPVELPLPRTTRAGRGAAFEAARDAVNRAKSAPTALAVTGPDIDAATDVETAATLLALVITRRTSHGAEAVELARTGLSQTEIARTLGISKQAVSQRLSTAGWHSETAGRRLVERLLTRAESPNTGGGNRT